MLLILQLVLGLGSEDALWVGSASPKRDLAGEEIAESPSWRMLWWPVIKLPTFVHMRHGPTQPLCLDQASQAHEVLP